MGDPYDGRARMTSDDTDPTGTVEAGLAALLAAQDEFERAAAAGNDPAAHRPPPRAARSARPGDAGVLSARRLVVAVPVAMLALALLAVALFARGWDEVRRGRAGQVVSETQDPTAPGWEALTTKTPTLLVIQTGADGKPTGFAVLAVSSEKTAGVLVIPPNGSFGIPGIGQVRFDDAYTSAGGITSSKAAIELLLGTGLGEVAVVDAVTWGALIGPTAPIEVENRDAVKIDGKVAYPTGPLALKPEDVGPYLSAGSGGRDEVNHLLRMEMFWRSWLAKIRQTGTADQLPGESGSGLGRFLRDVASRKVTVWSLPSKPIATGASTAFAADEAQLGAVMTELVPFPVSPQPGVRLRAKLLDGTGRYDHGIRVAPAVVAAGTELVAIGNARSFDVSETLLVYFDDEQKAKVEALAAKLGIGKPTRSQSPPVGVDVQVILGADADPLVNRSGQSVVTSPATVVGTTILGGKKRG